MNLHMNFTFHPKVSRVSAPWMLVWPSTCPSPKQLCSDPLHAREPIAGRDSAPTTPTMGRPARPLGG